MMQQTQTRAIIIILSFWAILAGAYCTRTLPDERSPDWWGQSKYTQIVVTKNRLPHPYENWSTYHPPLYYLINSFIAPSQITSNIDTHKNFVRLLSVIYGGINLIVILWFLQQATKNFYIQLMVLFFIASTPSYVFTFSTYNNNSLSTLLCTLMLALAYKLNKSWSVPFALLLLAIATIACYTKYTTLWCMLAICLISMLSLLRLKPPTKNQFKIFTIFCLSFLLFVPWIINHNHAQTGKLFPFNDEKLLTKHLSPSLLINNFKTRILIPCKNIQNTWKDPFVHPRQPSNPNRNSYIANSFISSVIGQWTYQKPSIQFILFLLAIHFVIRLGALLKANTSELTKLATLLITVVYCIQIGFILTLTNTHGLGYAFGFRYIVWTFTAWAILFAHAISKDSFISIQLRGLLMLGIIYNIYFLMTVVGGHNFW